MMMCASAASNCKITGLCTTAVWCHVIQVAGLSPQVPVSLLLHRRCVTARGGDLQCLWPLVSHIRPPHCSSLDRLTHLRRQIKFKCCWDREHFIQSGVCCHFTLTLLLLLLLLFPLFPLFMICLSACAEMGRWSVCQKIKVTSLHSSSLQFLLLFFLTTKRCFRLSPSCRSLEPWAFVARFPTTGSHLQLN